MAQLDEPTSEAATRAAFDKLIEQNPSTPSLYDRAEALDCELGRIETSLRVTLSLSAGPNRVHAAQAWRIVCLRRLLDLVWFLDRHRDDEVLKKRLLELKRMEEGVGVDVDK